MKSLFLFSDQDSFLHRLDPRPKFLVVIATLTYVMLFEQPAYMFAALGIIVALIWGLGGLSPAKYWRVLLFLVPMIVVVSLIQSLTYHPPGTTYLAMVGPFRVATDGLVRGAGVGGRLGTMALSFMLFSMTTTPKEVGLALNRTGVPYKYAYLATMGLRFLPLMQEDLSRLQNARAARGDPNVGSRNVFRRIISLQKSLFPLAATSLRQSNEIATALELRGYGASENRTTVDRLTIASYDYAVTALAIVSIAAIVYARFALHLGTLAS
ncbi:energy-coupling factor transporter transmembrane component T family protein [Halarchaeum nitratireducens]|uniref:Cobalt ABC transporter permease n=1 Tax=Halarchaeum nitratireducens TaxID=489913 RepID=A0A830GES0_9EURY|nr:MULTISPECIES: energy-coupling factor transporter transmembrane component T [Halarchaeum]MBP2252469.1 energy-coupling factor transport system permease protein [Halarchaeum solikamskense]GGN20989.1 cobalt ABC transporter permease [Halarchaeum nitratireducens]